MERKWDLLADFMRRANLPPSNCNWLDVGCGQGDLLRIGAKNFSSAAGCDLSSEMLQGCTDLDVRLQTEPTRLPFESGRFHLVTAVCVYHHVKPSQRAALTADLVRVLKRGGIACVIEHNPFNPVTRLIVHRTPVDADAQLLTAAKTKQMLGSSGLVIAESRYFLYLPEKLYRKLGRLESWLSDIPAGGQYAVFARK